MAKMPRTDETNPAVEIGARSHNRHSTVSWAGHARQVATTALGVLFFSVMPAAAQAEGGSGLVEQLGTDIGASGGGVLAFVVWFILMLILIVKGLGRCYSAVDHMGSLHEDKRQRGREEIKFGGITFAAGLIGVPVAATFVGRILPASWSWMGVDLTQYVQLPGAGTIYIPVGETMDAAMFIFPALV